MKRLALTPLLLLSLVTVASAQESYLKIKYDKFEDRRSVMVWHMPLGRGAIGGGQPSLQKEGDELHLTVIHTHKGAAPATVRLPVLTVYAILATEGTLGVSIAPKLILLIDSERYSVKTEWTRTPFSEAKTEAVYIKIDARLLSKMATAKIVEGRLGHIEFHLVRSHQAALKGFLEAISPARRS